MQIFVKTLKGTHFKIEVKPDATVADVKQNIETMQGQSVYPADQQMLIHQGKVLKDETTLAENNVADKTFIVIMLRKAKGSSSGTTTTTTTPSSQPLPASSASADPPVSSQVPPTEMAPAAVTAPASVTGSASLTAPASGTGSAGLTAPASGTRSAGLTAPALVSSSPTTTTAPTPAVSASDTADAYDQAASNLVAGNNLEQAIQQIIDIGGGTWDRDTVVRAMRAAFNNPERAVDYLYSGIPEQAELTPPVIRSPTGGQVTTNPPSQAPQPTQSAIPSSGPNANPLDLFPQGLPSMGANTAAGSLDFLRNSPQFRALQAMVQANPQILQPMLQELSRQNPHIMGLIQDHQSEFLRLINEPAEGGEGNLLGQLASSMPHALTVTPEEREAIERLEAMGFNRTLVLEVYFACNKDEELAANYLLDHMHEFDD